MDKLTALNDAFMSFKRHLVNNFDVTVVDEERLFELFLNQLNTWVTVELENHAQSGCFLDEMYGDDILECVQS